MDLGTNGSLMSAKKPEGPPESGETELEVVVGDARRAWEKAVLEAGHDLCGNCGSDDRVRVRMVVPEDAGGKFVLGNGIALCRACDLTMDLTTRYTEPVQRKRPVNFWVSSALYKRLHAGSEKTSFRSMAGLIRFLMTKYVTDHTRFDDLSNYQDTGTDVKVNVWVEDGIYARFKELADRNGLTVTSALKGLLGMFEMEAAVILEDKDK
jgi:hypothetical protein